jgi:hypothetical protein
VQIDGRFSSFQKIIMYIFIWLIPLVVAALLVIHHLSMWSYRRREQQWQEADDELMSRIRVLDEQILRESGNSISARRANRGLHGQGSKD